MVKEPNIADIAALSGVSVATVSRYFSGAGRVSEATAERIARICEQEGYSPKKYRHRNSRIYGALVGIIVADLNNVFFLEIIQSITEPALIIPSKVPVPEQYFSKNAPPDTSFFVQNKCAIS